MKLKMISLLSAVMDRRLLDIRLTNTALSLYVALWYVCNKLGQEDEFSVANSTLMNLADIDSKPYFNKTRNQLIQAGLVEYEKGHRGSSGKYRLIPIYNTNDLGSPQRTQQETYLPNVGIGSLQRTQQETYLSEDGMSSLQRNQQRNQQRTQQDTQQDTQQRTQVRTLKRDRERVRDRDIDSRRSIYNYNNIYNTREEDDADIEAFVDLWNSTCFSLTKVTMLDEKRKGNIKARLELYSMEQVKEAMEKVEASDFCTGRSGGKWHMTFDYFIKDDSVIAKAIDGGFDDWKDSERSWSSGYSQDEVRDIEQEFMNKYTRAQELF